MSRRRIAVLASGGGSNLQAIHDYFVALDERRAADLVVVATDRSNAGALTRATSMHVPGVVTRSKLAPDAQPLAAVLDTYTPDLIVLAGYLQLIPADITQQYRGRMINVHPAPLPAFGGAGMYGARVHRAVVTANAAMSGPTVHFVDDKYDHGPAIAHWPVPVLEHDDEHSLGARVLRAEHLLYPRVVQAVAKGEVALDSAGVVDPPFLSAPIPPLDPALTDGQLVAQLDHATRSSLRL